MEDRLPRKLAAILDADGAGYSCLTGKDKEGTRRLLSNYLDAFSATIQNCEGRVVHFAGDAILAGFRGVSQTMTCAAAVQQELAGRDVELPEAPRVRFRIGENLGGDPDQDYLTDGVAESLIIALSKVPKMFVIATRQKVGVGVVFFPWRRIPGAAER